jgi:hypothetical protein
VRRRVTTDKTSRPQSEVINQILIEKFKVRTTPTVIQAIFFMDLTMVPPDLTAVF